MACTCTTAALAAAPSAIDGHGLDDRRPRSSSSTFRLRIGSGGGGFVAQIGVIDFTGGLVVHVSAGTGVAAFGIVSRSSVETGGAFTARLARTAAGPVLQPAGAGFAGC